MKKIRAASKIAIHLKAKLILKNFLILVTFVQKAPAHSALSLLGLKMAKLAITTLSHTFTVYQEWEEKLNNLVENIHEDIKNDNDDNVYEKNEKKNPHDEM